MSYQPFLIAPFRTGLDTDQEPWLLPQDAFTNIVNGHIHHGYIEKRNGYRQLGRMVHGRAITAATNANPAVFTVNSATGLSNGDSVSLHYLAGGTWNSLNGTTYTITGLVGATFSLLDSSGTAVDGTALGAYTASSGRLGDFPGLRIMGIMRFLSPANERILLISDTERVAIYSGASDIFEPLDLFDSTSTLRTNSPVWASANTNYIWFANWQPSGAANRVYLTNGKAFTGATPGTDGIVFYDGQNARVEQFQPSLGGSNILYGCKLMFTLNGRLVCLFTYEYDGASTTTYPQRARWSAINNPGNFAEVPGGGSALDAATGDQIISAQLLQNQIIVQFTNSVWTLRSLSNPAVPFKWEKINNFRACDTKMGTLTYDRYVFSIGNRGITATDGIETRRVDDRIEDFVDTEINQENFEKVFAERDYSNRRSWILYPKETDDEAEYALIYDDESGAYSKYRFTKEVSGSVVDMNALGFGRVDQDYTFADFIAENDLDWSWSDADDETFTSFYWGKNDEWFLGGDRVGYIDILETGGSDNGNGISFSLESAAWNPYKEQGAEVQFGYVDFYVDADIITKLTVAFYKNDDENPYSIQEIDCLPNLTYITQVTDVLPNSDPTTGFVIEAPSHGLSANDYFYVYGVEGPDFYNNVQWQVSSVTENQITVASDVSGFGSAITGISQANPGVVTSAAHGFENGDVIYIVDVSGMTEVNAQVFTVASVTTNTYELSGVDTTGFTAYTSGGFAFYSYLAGGELVEREFYRTKVWKRAYAGGIGYQHRIRVDSIGANKPLRISAIKPWFRPVGRRILG